MDDVVSFTLRPIFADNGDLKHVCIEDTSSTYDIIVVAIRKVTLMFPFSHFLLNIYKEKSRICSMDTNTYYRSNKMKENSDSNIINNSGKS